MKTQSEITYLKANWLLDPCWDIEDTDGFEEHRQELLEWRQKINQEWKRKELDRVDSRAKELGCTHELVKCIEDLERKIRDLEEAQ